MILSFASKYNDIKAARFKPGDFLETNFFLKGLHVEYVAKADLL